LNIVCEKRENSLYLGIQGGRAGKKSTDLLKKGKRKNGVPVTIKGKTALLPQEESGEGRQPRKNARR